MADDFNGEELVRLVRRPSDGKMYLPLNEKLAAVNIPIYLTPNTFLVVKYYTIDGGNGLRLVVSDDTKEYKNEINKILKK